MDIITNWENDLIELPEQMVEKFVSEKYPNYEFKMLSALRHRDIQDIYGSLKESRIIIMQPSLFDRKQVAGIVKAISHPIHVNNNGARREWDIRDFIFLSANPFVDLSTVKEFCRYVKDDFDDADALNKILHNANVHFFGFNGEHYEMKEDGYFNSDIYAIRHK